MKAMTKLTIAVVPWYARHGLQTSCQVLDLYELCVKSENIPKLAPAGKTDYQKAKMAKIAGKLVSSGNLQLLQDTFEQHLHWSNHDFSVMSIGSLHLGIPWPDTNFPEK